MSAWETISVALGSGAVGTVIGTLLNNNHQRAAELRNMRLTASTEFIRRADTAIRFLRRPHPGAHYDDPFYAATDMWDQLVEAVQVIHLLFGHDCEPSEWARTTSNKIHDAREELLGVIETEGTSAQPAEVHLSNAQEALDLFTTTARAVIWESRWLPLRGRLSAAMHKPVKHPASAEVPPGARVTG